MATIINADTVTGGAIITGDNSGVLQLKTGGTTALTLGADQSATFAGTVSATGGFTGVNLATGVTGTLPTTNGGTGSTSTTYCSLTTNVTGTLPTTNGGTGSTSTTYCSLATNVTGTLPLANGGTGQTTKAAAFNALSPITSTGDLILGNGSNSATRLAIGTNGQVLTSDGTTASWATASGGPVVLIQTQTVSGVSQVDFTGLSTYNNYFIIANYTMSASTSGCNLRFQTGGSTWLTSYERGGGRLGSAYAGVSGSNDRIEYTQTDLSGGQNISVWIDIFNMTAGTSIISRLYQFSSSSTHVVGGYASGTVTKTGIRLYPGTGTYTGTFSLYGVKTA